MSQRHDSHPYMSKAQLNDYLASLRNTPHNNNTGHTRSQPSRSSTEDSDDRSSTPLVRALKEKYGSGNTNAGYVDVGVTPKGRQSPTKRALPPVPGVKSDQSTGWRVTPKAAGGYEERKEIPEEIPYVQEGRRSPTKRNDFWTTGVVRPLPAAPRTGNNNKPDPRDELRMPINAMSINDSQQAPPTIASPSINVPSIPTVSVPSINAPSINVPSSSSPPTLPDKPEKSWPSTVHVRSKSSPALLCAMCTKPIAGRIVTAIGSRFHPDCFRCDKCRTELVISWVRRS